MFFISAWTILGSIGPLEYYLPKYLARTFNIGEVVHLAAGSFNNLNSAYSAVINIRYVFSALFVVCAFIGFLLARKYRNKADSFFLSLAIAALVVVISSVYGSELWERAYLFALIPLSYFIVKLLNVKYLSIILLLALLIALPLNIISHYGSALADRRSYEDIRNWHFIQDHTVNGCVIGGLGLTDPGYSFSQTFLERYEWKNGLLTEDEAQTSRPQYVRLGDSDIKYYHYVLNDTESIPGVELLVSNSPHYNFIYSNPSMKTFIFE